MPLDELVMDALTLAVALRLAGRRPRLPRILPGALLGTLCSMAVRRLGLTHGQSAALWLPIAAVMMLIAGGDRRKPIRGALLVMSAAGLLGGLVLALSSALGSLPMAYLLAIVCALGSAAYASRAGKSTVDKARVQIDCRGRRGVFEALMDSGNGLRDYLTGRPVIVLPEEEGRRRLGLEGAALRPIVAKTAGGEQMMWCFLPERTVVIVNGRRKRAQAVVALSPGLTGEAPALVPIGLME